MIFNNYEEVFVMDYSQEYKQKLVSADEAVKLIKSGDWVDFGWCTNTVDALDQALAKRTDELTNVNLRGGILLKPLATFAREDAGEHFTWNSWHMSGIERKMISRGCAFYSPIRYSELPRYYRELDCPDDVAMFQVAPMDSHGYFNFGPSASHLGAMCERAKHIIVEVNENMPRCLGGTECGVHISDVTYIVEGSNPPIGELGAGGPATDIDKTVAKLIVDEIPNGACLQLGIGGMPNAVGSLIAESDLKDLGVHTEMYVDAFVDIAKAGKITGAHHYKCDVLVSQEAFGKRIAEDKIKVAWLQQGSCLIYAKTIQRQGVFTAEDGNILFFLRKIVSNDLEIKMEACMRAIHKMLSFIQNISSNS